MLSSCLSVYVLAGCGGSQPPVGAPGAMPQTSALATHADLGKSWMAPKAKSDDLLYIAAGPVDGRVYVYTYPKGRLVGTLTGFWNRSASVPTPKATYSSLRTRTRR
jgi:hypothetical protein